MLLWPVPLPPDAALPWLEIVMPVVADAVVPPTLKPLDPEANESGAPPPWNHIVFDCWLCVWPGSLRVMPEFVKFTLGRLACVIVCVSVPVV